MSFRWMNLLLCLSVCFAQMVCCCAIKADRSGAEVTDGCCHCQPAESPEPPAGEQHDCPCKSGSWFASEVQSPVKTTVQRLFGIDELSSSPSGDRDMRHSPGGLLTSPPSASAIAGRALLRALQIMRC
jgi:hypothetical protein